MTTKPTLTAGRLRELLDYDPDTGAFTWRVRPYRNSRRRAGDEAGHICRTWGYRLIGIGGRHYRAHRLAWVLVTGTWPAVEVDHVNGIRDDNRWMNLRAVTHIQNCQNGHGLKGDNTSGLTGASYHRASNRWRATIGHEGRQIALGYFSTAAEAHDAYLAAKREFHPFSTL